MISGSYLLLLISSFAVMVSYISSASVDGRPIPNFGQRRLFNLSGNSVGDMSVESMDVPAALAVQSESTAVQLVKAEGFQGYQYAASWELVSASADLFSSEGDVVGEHSLARGGQPTWKSLDPPSVVIATSIASSTVIKSAIPWSLYQTTSSSGSSSVFGAVSYVQRLETTGGLPPDASHVAKTGDTYNSPYSATYVFYAKK